MKRVVHFMQTTASKSFLHQGIQNFKACIERQYETDVRVFHTRDDPTLANVEFQQELKVEDLVHERPVVYIHEQNDLVERGNQHQYISEKFSS